METVNSLHLCVVLNGPPGCGKDTLANRLIEYGFTKHQMKDELYKAAADYFAISRSSFVDLATDRDLKELPHTALTVDGRHIMTPRQAMIHVSENVYKPQYGEDYFGKQAAKRCDKARSTLAVFSDGGFPSEIAPLEALYEHVVIIRLHRKGCTFENDSRNYLQGFPNTHDLQLLEGQIDFATQLLLLHLDSYLPLDLAS